MTPAEYLRGMIKYFPEYLEEQGSQGRPYLCFVAASYTRDLEYLYPEKASQVSEYLDRFEKRIGQSLEIAGRVRGLEDPLSFISPLLRDQIYGRLYYLQALVAEELIWRR